MTWRRDDRGEYTLDLVGNRLPLMTFDQFEAVRAGCESGVERNRKVREAFKVKLNRQQGKVVPSGEDRTKDAESDRPRGRGARVGDMFAEPQEVEPGVATVRDRGD